MKALEDAAYCPRLVDVDGHLRAYTPNLTVPGVVRCSFGADEMVKVGSFWIDRYEELLVPDTFYSNLSAPVATNGTCDGTGTPYASSGGNNAIDDYPGGFPDHGHWAVKVYACSVAGHVPSRKMTWFQAQQACTIVGKRMCRNSEWQAAVAGTDDPDISNGTGGKCVTSGAAPRATGGGTACRSVYGAEDMIGNLQEWVADWFAAAGTDQANLAPPDQWGPALYKSDVIKNVSGGAFDGELSAYARRPAAAIRGGDWDDGLAAGAFTLVLSSAPSDWGGDIGSRCCAGGS